MTENFPKLILDTKPQIQKPQGTSRRINAKNNVPRYFQITENQRQRKNVREGKRKEHLTYRVTKTSVTSNFFSEAMIAKRY